MKRLSLLLSTLIPLTAGVVLDDFTQSEGGVISLTGCVNNPPHTSERAGTTIMGGSGVRGYRIYSGCWPPHPPGATLTAEVDHGLKLRLDAGLIADFYLYSVGQPYTITADDRYLLYEVAESAGVYASMYVGFGRNGLQGRPIPVAQFIPPGPGRYYFDLAGGPIPLLPGTVFDSYELILLPLGPLPPFTATQDVRLTISRLEIVAVPEPLMAAPVALALAAVFMRRAKLRAR